jgi:hypothetical protein
MTTMLTEHFSLEEFLHSDTAERESIPNVPDESALKNLTRLASVMEEVRAICGNYPVTITSGYRGPELNAAIGGASNSAHLYGLACDFTIAGAGPPIAICTTLEIYLEPLGIDQLILEYDDWTHLGLVDESMAPRHQALTINNSGTTTGFA